MNSLKAMTAAFGSLFLTGLKDFLQRERERERGSVGVYAVYTIR